jgi:hypothetical protein
MRDFDDPAQPNWHRTLIIKDTGESFCGDFACGGECGMPKLVRLRPTKVCTLYPDGYVVEQASALCGIEPVWSNERWEQSQPWDGDVVMVEYDESMPYWF